MEGQKKQQRKDYIHSRPFAVLTDALPWYQLCPGLGEKTVASLSLLPGILCIMFHKHDPVAACPEKNWCPQHLKPE